MNCKLFTLAAAMGVLALVGCGQEKKAAASAQPKTVAEKLQVTSFVEMDVNKDGQVTYNEFDQVTGNNGEKEGNLLYVEIDKNGDGIINSGEMPAPAAAAPEKKK